VGSKTRAGSGTGKAYSGLVLWSAVKAIGVSWLSSIAGSVSVAARVRVPAGAGMGRLGMFLGATTRERRSTGWGGPGQGGTGRGQQTALMRGAPPGGSSPGAGWRRVQ
jgi:hypothetical protein